MKVVTRSKREKFVELLRKFKKTCTCTKCEAALEVVASDLEFFTTTGMSRDNYNIRITCSQCSEVNILGNDPELTDLAAVFSNVMESVMEEGAALHPPQDHPTHGLGGDALS